MSSYLSEFISPSCLPFHFLTFTTFMPTTFLTSPSRSLNAQKNTLYLLNLYILIALKCLGYLLSVPHSCFYIMKFLTCKSSFLFNCCLCKHPHFMHLLFLTTLWSETTAIVLTTIICYISVKSFIHNCMINYNLHSAHTLLSYHHFSFLPGTPYLPTILSVF